MIPVRSGQALHSCLGRNSPSPWTDALWRWGFSTWVLGSPSCTFHGFFLPTPKTPASAGPSKHTSHHRCLPAAEDVFQTFIRLLELSRSSAATCRLQLKLLMGAPLGLAQLALSGYLLTTSPKLGLCSTLPGPLPPGGPSIRPECSSGSRMSARLAASTTETPVRCPLLRGLPTAPHVAAPFGLTWQCLSCSEAVFFIYVVIYSLECQYLEDKGLVRFIHKGVPGVLESVVGDCAQRMLNNHSSTNKQVAKP